MKNDKIAIIVSRNDPAGMNIKSFLDTRTLPTNASVHLFDELSIYNENVDKKVDADIYLFATTHRSKSGKPSITTHVPGNWAKAELGGSDNILCIAPALYIRAAFIELQKVAKESIYEPIMEVTHHGPLLEKPCFFMEIGSDETAWNDPIAGEKLATAIINTITAVNKEHNTEKIISAAGIGGLHNVPVLSKFVEKNNFALGHICPKYMLEQFTEQMLVQAIEKTIPRAELILVDWKGLGEYKTKVKVICESVTKKLSIEWKRSDKV